MEQEYKYMVATRCFTFNHAPYIEDALRGFVMQETSFPTLFLIIDDCSTDGEQEILRNWAETNLSSLDGDSIWRRLSFGDVAEGILREKTNLSFAVLLLSENHHCLKKPKLPYLTDWLKASKYHALCEGDDYWIDSMKLQKQVDFMEANLDYTLCFHAIYEKYEGAPRLNKIRANIEDREYTGIEWYKNRPSQTASFCFCGWITYDPFYKGIINNKKFIAGDVPLLLSCAQLGKIRGMSDVMSVYRHNETGWTQKKRSKDEIMRIADSQLEYRIFGKEFESAALTYYNRECVKAFIYSFRDKPDFSYIPLSLKKSIWGTCKAFVSVIVSYLQSKI